MSQRFGLVNRNRWEYQVTTNFKLFGKCKYYSIYTKDSWKNGTTESYEVLSFTEWLLLYPTTVLDAHKSFEHIR